MTTNKRIVLGMFVLGIAMLPLMGAKYTLNRTGNSVKSFTISCGTSATLIDAGAPYTSVQCTQLDVVQVYMGGADVSSSNGYPVCSDRSLCGTSTEVISANNAYCVVSTGTEVINCLAVME